QQRNESRARAKESNVLQTTMTGVVENQSATLVIEPQNAEKKSHVPDTSGDERFFCGGRGARPFNPEADQQIRRETNQLPKNKEQEQTVGHDDAQHCAGEKRKISEEPGEMFVVRHVADAE